MMEYFGIKKKDGNIISCVKEIPENMTGVVIAIHGFASSKDSSTYRLLRERLPLKGYGVVCIDLPGHGKEESAKEILRIAGAIDSIDATEKYVLRNYPGFDICYFASSFGAYLTGLYLSTRPHSGRKFFWRSAAVNMPELICKDGMTEEERQYRRDLDKQGFFDVSMDDSPPVRITQGMYDDLLTYNLFEMFDPDRFGENHVTMVHGKEDIVIIPDKARLFAERFRIPVTWFSREGHSLSNDIATPNRVVDTAVSFFGKSEQ